ncbi:MAG: hypothetical protein ACXWRA_16525 [Pseudobdellovibrionaceae bacterium]
MKTLGSNSNGQNYDGKPYVNSDATAPCVDIDGQLNPIRSVIVETTTGYQLVKKDCVVLSPPLALATADVSSDPTYSGILTYQDKKFIFDTVSYAATAPPADLSCTRQNIGPVDSVKIYSVSGINGPQLVGVVVEYGVSINVVFGETVLDTSTTATLSARNQDMSDYLSFYNFDPTNQHPDNTNTQYQFGTGPLGTTGFLLCQRPSGGL